MTSAVWLVAGLVVLVAGAEVLVRGDAWVMLAVAVVCLPVFVSGMGVARWEGFVFLLGYLAYTAPSRDVGRPDAGAEHAGLDARCAHGGAARRRASAEALPPP